MQSTTPCPIPFESFSPGLAPQTGERATITSDTRRAEHEMVGRLLDAIEPPTDNGPAMELAWRLASTLRDQTGLPATEGLAQMLLQEFSLSSEEGIALMCLAESILRIPDTATQDALIRDKISKGRWSAHLGHSSSLFVNAAVWGLLLTGRLYAAHQGSGPQAALAGLIEKGGEPLVRRAVDAAMRLLGDQFVAGRTVEQALDRSRAQVARGYTHSYDMLGEAAMTEADALRYASAYDQAIHRIGASCRIGTPH